jgi:hypothetical protein
MVSSESRKDFIRTNMHTTVGRSDATPIKILPNFFKMFP